MNIWTRLRSWTAATLWRSRKEREMDEEMRFHMEAHAADLIARVGRSPDPPISDRESSSWQCRRSHGCVGIWAVQSSVCRGSELGEHL
jgi:hypothetical protein